MNFFLETKVSIQLFLKLSVITHIKVCIHIYKYSYKCTYSSYIRKGYKYSYSLFTQMSILSIVNVSIHK